MSAPTLHQFARTILLGDRLEDKLIPLVQLQGQDHDPPHAALTGLPRFPGRPPRLARIGKAEFPRLDRLAQDATARGQVLHFFANHELLAMELMALVLLKFPEAPPAFRAGLARTITEEQSHLRLYIDRMRELGVDFGDLPLSEYFWNAMKDSASPLEFVTQMSLTLEQANLDFSLFYRDAVRAAGDEKTALILERVYQEEIGHVKHGLQWFNRWRMEGAAAAESDWDAYLRLLPPPMSPRRAKGLSFAAEPRRLAGLSERFISELEIYGGSKGRPPVLWHYNPLCDAEIARGKPGLTPTDPVRRLSEDVEPLLMNLAGNQDVVLTSALPRAEWLKNISRLGFAVPEFRLAGKLREDPRETKLAGIEPWGWSPESFERFRSCADRLIFVEGTNGTWARTQLARADFSEAGLGKFFSKAWSTEFFRRWAAQGWTEQIPDIGQVHQTWQSAQVAASDHFARGGGPLLAKAPYGTSGTQNKRLLDASELEGPIGGWIRGVIEAQTGIVIEPWLAKIADLSLQLEVRKNQVELLGIRRFFTGSRLEYRGADLDPRLSSLGADNLRYLHSPQDGASPLERWRELARAVGHALAEDGYEGPAGIDALLHRLPNGALRLKPLVELNPRWTMGRVALAIEAHVLPGVPARWHWIQRRDLPADTPDFAAFARRLEALHPVAQARAGDGMRISEGLVFTTDPERAREVLTVLAVGRAASLFG
jgi:uncharacterized ferritin-like protein (DUF455 family)